MGLINKIEEKLSSSSNNNEEQSKLQKSPPNDSSYSSGSTTGNTGSFTSPRTGDNSSGAPEEVRHPISSTGGKPTGSAVDSYSSTPTTSTSQYGNQGSLAMPVAYQSHTGSTTQRAPQTTTTTTMTDGRAPVTTTTHGQGPRQPYDPYSAKGQQIAADHGSRDTMSGINQPQEYAGSHTATAPAGVARSPQGGVLNQTEQSRYPPAGTVGDSRQLAGDRYVASSTHPHQPTSDHHYARDAGIIGGAGATGVGAYETGKHSGTTSQPGMTSQAPIGQTTTHGASDPAYLNRDNIGGGQQDPTHRPFQNESAGMGGAGALGANTGSLAGGGAEANEHPGLSQARKMGGAYEAGYRDAMEHMKADLQKSQLR